MIVMRTTKYPAYSVGELVSSQQSVGFDDLALGVYPLRLYGIEPRTLLGQQAAHDPHSALALLDFSVVLSEPAPDLFGDVPARVVPDEKQHSLARRLELLATPRKEPRGYVTDRPPIHEPQPRIVEFWQVEAVAGDGLRLGVIFGNRPLDERRSGFPSSLQLLRVGKATLLHQHSSKKPTAHSGRCSARRISCSRRLFSLVQRVGGGDPALRPLPPHSEKA